jgi:hypothetical protein
MTVEERLDRIEAMLAQLVEREAVRQWYSVDEFARIVGRSEFTCREWCRLRRIAAGKKASGRGKHAAWAISHAELLRYQREGLLPVPDAHSGSYAMNVSEPPLSQEERCLSNPSQPTLPFTP